MSQPLTLLCISCFFKGQDFLRSAKKEGCRVFFLTKKDLADKDWPRESIDEFFYLDDDANTAVNFENMTKGLAFLMRHTKIDRIIALDDFDVEKAAYLREFFRIPGMGQTTARYFRDKLAMRTKAAEEGIPVPAFTALFNDEEINTFLQQVAAPWLIKPRAEASATGIRKIETKEAFWEVIHELGEERVHYLAEQFKPGDVYHVDALTVDGKVAFSRASRYLNTPFEVAHGGGIFRTQTLPEGRDDDIAAKALNKHVMEGFGMQFSASHTEFIRANEDGKFYFLETSSRVGGAHIAEMVEAASGLNLWTEWARIEVAMAQGKTYKIPTVRDDYAGILVSLIRYQRPDYASFTDPEIVWRLEMDHHIGMIVRSDTEDRVAELLDQYAERVFHEFHASAPPADKPTN